MSDLENPTCAAVNIVTRSPVVSWIAAAVLSTVAAAPCGAQGTGASLTHPGTLSTSADSQVGAPLPPGAPRRAALASADDILAILRRDDGFAHPIGYATAVHRAAGLSELGSDDNRLASLPPHFGVAGTLSYFDLEVGGHGGQQFSPVGTKVDFSVVANGIGRVPELSYVPVPIDGGPPIFGRYRVTGQLRGRPIYNGECTYVTNRPVPPLLPVTRDRYLRLMILSTRADSARHESEHRSEGATPMAGAFNQWLRDRPKREADRQAAYEMMKKMDPAAAKKFLDESRKQEAAFAADSVAQRGQDQGIKTIENSATDAIGERIRTLQAQLDALSPGDRQKPVAVVIHGVDWDWRSDELRDFDDPDSDPLVQLNPSFYDKSIAPTVPQIIWICLPGLQGQVDKGYENYAGDTREAERAKAERRLHDAVLIRDHLDWAALEALVRR